MLTTKEINKRIGGIRKSTKALRENIHEVLCHIAGHAYEHQDVSGFTRLFNAVVGADRHAIGQWVTDHGFAKLDAKTGAFTLNKAARKDAAFNDGDAVVSYMLNNADPWYAYVKSSSQVAADLDIEKQVQSLIKRIKKAREDGDRDIVVSDTGTTKAMRELEDLVGQIREERQESNAPLMIAAE